jgi:hypothetical protein
MPYTITKTDGTTITVDDGDTNDNSTSLTLIGKNFPGYGVFLNQNFVRLLENFSSQSSPDTVTGSPALQGQLWWDKSNKLLKVYQGTEWKVISSSMSSANPPATDVPGDLWWDTGNNQLKVYPGGVGAEWVTIGPAFTTATGQTGALAENIADNTSNANNLHSVIKFYIDSDLVAILSQDTEFTPASSSAAPGFSAIKPGFNLSTVVASGLLKYNGTATSADSVGGIDPTNLARKNTTNVFTSQQQISNSSGLIIGDNRLQLKVESNAPVISSLAAGTNLTLNTPGNSAQLVLKSNGYVEVSANVAAGSPTTVATKGYVDGFFDSTSASASLKRDGSVTINGVLRPETAATGTIDIGATGARFRTVFANTFSGQASTALYADLAERFESDSAYSPGTVVELGGAAEITKVGDELSENVFGVISTRAAYLMNAGVGTDETHPPVAISGRVPVRVVGTVKKGDRLVSAGNGLARAASRSEITPWNVIGRALTSKTTSDEGTVEAIVKLNS